MARFCPREAVTLDLHSHLPTSSCVEPDCGSSSSRLVLKCTRATALLSPPQGGMEVSLDICCHQPGGPGADKPKAGARAAWQTQRWAALGAGLDATVPLYKASPFPSFCARRTPGLRSLSYVAPASKRGWSLGLPPGPGPRPVQKPQQALPSFPAVTWCRQTLCPPQGPFRFQGSAAFVSNKMHGEKEEKIT